ncbi:MAG: pseudouridine synthase, partial [Bacteroidota bacterium]|nr:pseudouridine synthase [Bacteroidota bacterium]
KRSYTKREDKPAYNDRGPEKRSYTKREDKPAYNDRGPEKRSYTKREDKPAYNDRGPEKRSYTKREDKPAYNDRGPEKRSYTKREDKPSYNDRGTEKRTYTKREDKPSYNDRGTEKRTYTKREDKPSYNDRGPEKRTYTQRGPDYNGDRSRANKEGGESFDRKPANNHESGSYERKPRSYDSREKSYDKKPAGDTREKGSYNRTPRTDSTKSYDRKPASDGRDTKSYDRKPNSYDNREKSYDRKPSAEGRSYDKPAYDKPDYPKAPKAKQPKAPDEVRLNRYLSNAGIASRRDADIFIAAGLVKVNGVVVTEMGVKVKPTDEVIYNNERLSGEKKVYFLMNKPKDYITTNEDPQGRKTVLDLVKNFSKERVFPVGRLDRNTTGVLVLTNDGDIAQRLSHPKFGVKKVYKVGLDKNITPAILNQLRNGIVLEDGPVQLDVVDFMDPTDKKIVGVEIHSGRNRIVRRMFESLGFEVIRLDRLAFAGLDKKGLKRGEIRHLTDKEVSQLRGLK